MDGGATSSTSPWYAALGGVTGGAVALAIGELAAGLIDRSPSFVVAVGDVVVDRAPTDVVRFGIDAFGRSDKPVLLAGVVVITLALGGLGAMLAWRRCRRGPLVAVFGSVTAVGMVLCARYPDARLAAALLVPLAAGVIGLWVALTLVGLLPPPATVTAAAAGAARPGTAADLDASVPGTEVLPFASPLDPPASRRAFLGWAAAGTGLAATAALGGNVLQRQLVTDATRRAIALPAVASAAGGAAVDGTLDGIAGITPYRIANDSFYRIDTALLVPRVDLASWRLRVGGLVERPFELTFDELVALADVEADVTLSCVSNRVGGDLVGNARWQGVPLATLLERAGVRPEGTQLVGRSVDGWTGGFPTPAASDGRTALVAIAMNGEPLPARHGFPARLVVAGLYGYVSATKWLSEIELVPWDAFDGYWMPRGWSKEGPVKTQSRIDVPGEDATVDAGAQVIAGVAWAPTRGIEQVEVQVDDGPWRDASLGSVVSDETWVQWQLPWDATTGRHRIRVRATDGTGATQPEQRSDVAPDGATGWHTVDVRVR